MLISVIIPAYNSADTIVEALESVAAQTVLSMNAARGSSFAEATEDKMRSAELTAKIDDRGWKIEDSQITAGQQDHANAARGAVPHTPTDPHTHTREVQLEVIVVDDCSTDETVEVVRKWMGKHPDTRHPPALRSLSKEVGGGGILRYSIRVADANGGPAAARNAGLREAKGEWIAFLDADDVWLPWRLEAQLEVVGMFPEAVLICAEETHDWTTPVRRSAVDSESCRTVLLKEFVDSNPVSTTTVLARKSAIDGAGLFDEQFRGPEDLDLWIRIAAAGRIVKWIAPVARYRERAGSLCLDPERFLPQVLKVYDKAFKKGGGLYGYRSFKRRAIAARYFSESWSALACGQRKLGIRLLFRSWFTYPRRLKSQKSLPFARLIMLTKLVFNLK